MVAPTLVSGPSRAPAPTRGMSVGCRWGIPHKKKERQSRSFLLYKISAIGEFLSHKGHYTEIFATRMTIFSE